MGDSLRAAFADVVACEECPRLRRWCREVARTKVRRFAGDDYWGKPVPGFGDPRARLLIVGLAPAAHGANRTGRLFTGDRSGDFLFAALHRAGFANQPESISRSDGLRLRDCYVSAIARCAPPANRLLPEEIRNCRSHLGREWGLLGHVCAVLALGKTAYDAFFGMLGELGGGRVPRPPFAHGVRAGFGEGCVVFGSYHPSQQNTFTGRLTPATFDRVIDDVRAHLS
jgi:uracil-DNA glycosylase family 4